VNTAGNEMTGGFGVTLTVERNGDVSTVGEIARCLICGHEDGFVLQLAVVRILALGESLGMVGPCCMPRVVREGLVAKCKEFSEFGRRTRDADTRGSA